MTGFGFQQFNLSTGERSAATAWLLRVRTTRTVLRGRWGKKGGIRLAVSRMGGGTHGSEITVVNGADPTKTWGNGKKYLHSPLEVQLGFSKTNIRSDWREG